MRETIEGGSKEQLEIRGKEAELRALVRDIDELEYEGGGDKGLVEDLPEDLKKRLEKRGLLSVRALAIAALAGMVAFSCGKEGAESEKSPAFSEERVEPVVREKPEEKGGIKSRSPIVIQRRPETLEEVGSTVSLEQSAGEELKEVEHAIEKKNTRSEKKEKHRTERKRKPEKKDKVNGEDRESGLGQVESEVEPEKEDYSKRKVTSVVGRDKFFTKNKGISYYTRKWQMDNGDNFILLYDENGRRKGYAVGDSDKFIPQAPPGGWPEGVPDSMLEPKGKWVEVKTEPESKREEKQKTLTTEELINEADWDRHEKKLGRMFWSFIRLQEKIFSGDAKDLRERFAKIMPGPLVDTEVVQKWLDERIEKLSTQNNRAKEILLSGLKAGKSWDKINSGLAGVMPEYETLVESDTIPNVDDPANLAKHRYFWVQVLERRFDSGGTRILAIKELTQKGSTD